MEEVIAEPEPLDSSRFGDSISVTIRFRPLSEREYQRGDEIAWYADGDKIVRNEYNPATAYAFDRVFRPHTNYDEVYEVAAKLVVKAAMKGVNGMKFYNMDSRPCSDGGATSISSFDLDANVVTV